MGGKSLRKCEVCGVRRVSKLKSDIFLARFPLNPNRCRLWVKATGNEDLAYLPIQRLNENKFICGNHFSKKMYNKKGNRLKRNAVPDLGLKTPLSDEILADFPICASGLETDEKEQANTAKRPKIGIPDTGYHWNSEHSYSLQKAYPEARPDSLPMKQTNIVTTEAKLGSELVVEGEVDESLDNCIDFSMYSDDEDNIECVEDTNDNSNKDSTEDSNNALLHEGFLCNFCNSTISGYRYTCVQCPDYDLCTSCEARGAHCLHYVLRIPRPKPYGEIKSLLDSVRTSLTLLNSAPDQVNILDMNDIKSETKDEEVDPFIDDDDIIEINAPETVESEHIPGDPLMEEIYTIEFDDGSTNNENISIDNPNEAKFAGSQHQITNTMETIPIVLKRRNFKIPPPPSSERKPEDTTKTEIYTIEFDDASTNNENKPIDKHNEAKTAGSQDQVTNTMEMKPIVLKSRKDKIPPPPSSVCKPEDPIKTDSKSAESAEAIVHRDQTPPRDRHKAVISQTDYKRLLNITTKPSAIKVISKRGTGGRKSATDRVIHVITVPKRLKKKKKLQQDVRLHVSRGLSKEEIKVVMKNVT